MKSSLVIIPTYNERETLPGVINAVLGHDGFDVLVVDDASPDGTADAVKAMMAEGKRVSLIERSGKLGLGTAYTEGFKWGLGREYEYFIEMDADGSHDPGALSSFLAAIAQGADLVIGSRYLNESISVVGWDFKRLLLSKFGNFYASWVLGLRSTDLTSGYRCFSRKALESIDLGRIHSNGYAFQIEMAYLVSQAGFRIGEIPIIFYERESGSSKMSKKIIREAVILPWKLRLGRMRHDAVNGISTNVTYHVRTITGFFLVIAGIAITFPMGLWLSTEGDIIEVIHRIKIGLPDWAWVAMKVGLSVFAAAALMGIFAALAVAIFAGSRRR